MLAYSLSNQRSQQGSPDVVGYLIRALRADLIKRARRRRKLDRGCRMLAKLRGCGARLRAVLLTIT